MRVLVIGEKERAEIAAVIADAKAHPLSFDELRDNALPRNKFDFSLADRKPDSKRPQSRNVFLPSGFRAAYSVEDQPVGLCAHLSISVEGPNTKKGAMPHPEAVKMIAAAFGIPFTANPAEMFIMKDVTIWLEEFEPGERAINLLHLYQPRPEGNA